MAKQVETMTSLSPPVKANEIVSNDVVVFLETKPKQISKPLTVVKILQRNKSPLSYICRPWHRIRRRDNPSKILVLTSQNYKVYADIGPSLTLMRRAIAVLETGAGSNLIRKDQLPPGMESRIAQGTSWDIGDANNRPLRTVGLIKMPVRLGKFVALIDFIVCDKLAVPLILGADYCDKFVEAIYPRKKSSPRGLFGNTDSETG